jgi:hypothetical protein
MTGEADEILLMLGNAAEVLDDIEKMRIGNGNRLAQMTRTGIDADGKHRGFGLSESNPEVENIAGIAAGAKKLEEDAVRNLERLMKRHPLSAWVKAQRGVGLKQAARLLAAVGTPHINGATGQPRTVSALWAYCGYHVIDGEIPKKRKGVQINWSIKAKTRAHLIAESCLKQLVKPCTAADGHVPDDCRCSPYRLVYDARRDHTDLTHPDWSDGRSHNDALRIASKAILRDLWRASRASAGLTT